MAKVFLLLALGLAPLTATSFEIYRENDRLFLRAPNCIEARKLTQDLHQWSKHRGENTPCKSERPIMTGASNCIIDITSCVPEHIIKYQGLVPRFSGPNCWNLALVVANILPGLRYSNDNEIDFYLRSPLCRKLAASEQPIAGDIGMIQSHFPDSSSNLHGFIYISNKIALSKNGHEATSAFMLQPLDMVFETYKTPQNCRKHSLPKTPTPCPIFPSYFRCQSMTDYLQQNPIYDKFLSDRFEKLNEIDVTMQNHTLYANGIHPDDKNKVIEITKALTQFANSDMKNLPRTKTQLQRNFILESLQLRIEAIAQQYILHHDVQAADDLLLLTGGLRYSVSELQEK